MLLASPPPDGVAGEGAPRPVSEKARAMADAEMWVDVHAHPGRCFLRGMASDDPLLGLLGADTMDQSLLDLKAGGVALASFATVADLRVLGPNADGGLCAVRDFAPGEARADHDRQIRALQGFAKGAGRAIVGRAADLERARSNDEVGLFLTCEGGDFLDGRMDGLPDAYERGARSITIVHYRVNEIGDIQTEAPVHGGLTDFGRAVVREMNRLGMIVDLAHATFEVTRDALAVSKHPVMISHTHLAAGDDAHPRLLREQHARSVAEAGGLIGAWPAGVAASTFEEYVDEIERLIALVGVDHVSIGTDMDANYKPVVEHYSQFPTIAESLLARGHTREDVGKVMGANFLRLFRAICG